MKKVLVVAPAYTRCSYGKMARFALRALREHEDKVDIYLNPTNWGQTGWMEDYSSEEYSWMQNLRIKTENHLKSGGKFDMSLQICTPNEFKKIATVNIGYTAGIEVTNISPAWLEPSNAMDKIFVISEHSKITIVDTVFQNQQGQTHKVQTEVETLHFPYHEVEAEPLDLNLTTSKNFLYVGQISSRKNLNQLLTTFLETFKDRDDVGIVLNVNRGADHNIDKDFSREILKNIMQNYKNHKCKVYMLHGPLTEGQKKSLYTNPNIKAFVTATHGETFDTSMFEAVCNDLPVIATNWSGHLDYLTIDGKEMFSDVKFQLAAIPDSEVLKGMMEKGTGWAFPDTLSLKKRMLEMVGNDYTRLKARAVKHGKWVREQFNNKKMMDTFSSHFTKEEQPFILI
jgi:glycosyltransferase involved in cell wall biosynthesis